MSNLKIKNQKEELRSTPFWQFTGIALIPLLLSLFVGYQWGHTADKENSNYKKLYTSANTELLALKEDIAAQQLFFHYADSIVNLVLEEKAPDWDRDYKAAFDEDEQIEEWRKIKKEYAKYEEKIEDFHRENDSKKSSLFEWNERMVGDFNLILDQRKKVTSLIGDKKAISLEKGIIEDLEEKKDDWEDEKDELEDEIKTKKYELKEKDLEIKLLADKLGRCEEDNVPTIDNNIITAKSNASKIVTEVETIRTEIIPDLNAKKLFGRKNEKLEKEVEQLKARMSAIYEAAVTSANL